ncbi:MAG: Asp-tRNA(Asn)/Glu-tRNA(Gln) amidotransferase subunit GatC [Rickettsiales bacterium]|jgi:aspartyl-tRNA(Asn)/glutamyl-tRNA(Gln) amidotransferase subunit C|nr:Asp-tRNA(Asn)/Glu-tRNA(Gln) amidotransferase subunit GatC [Rickettsiales bacterium]
MDKNKLRKLAGLAKIYVGVEDEDKILKLLNNDIETVKAIDKIDTDGLEGLVNPYNMCLETYDDVVSDGDKQKEIMNCAKKSMYNYFIAPKIIDN